MSLVPWHQHWLKASVALAVTLLWMAETAAQNTDIRATVTNTAASYRNPPASKNLERLPSLPSGHIVRVDLVLLDRTIEIARDERYRAWTFNGTIPGPVIRARVGDTIDVRLTNRAAMGPLDRLSRGPCTAERRLSDR
jgi:FtsP/CotA-like multicopper oxidase with cupredoxin domain